MGKIGVDAFAWIGYQLVIVKMLPLMLSLCLCLVNYAAADTGEEIRLGPNADANRGEPVARDNFKELLKKGGKYYLLKSRKDKYLQILKSPKIFPLYRDVNFLDTRKVAVNKLKGPMKFRSAMAGKQRIETVGIPLNSFYYYSYDLKPARNQTNRLILITDLDDRVIAVQELIETPKTIRLSEHNKFRSVYNFIQMRRKGDPDYKIAYRGSINGAVSVLETELLDRSYKPREYTKLILPYDMARLFRFICKYPDIKFKDPFVEKRKAPVVKKAPT